MLPISTRAALIVVVLSVLIAVYQAVRWQGRTFGVILDELTERDRGWVAGVRVAALGFALTSAILIAVLRRPDHVLAASIAGALCPPIFLALATRAAHVRHAPPALPWPRLVSLPHHLMSAAAVLIAAIAFSWMLPKLPSIVPLHWAPLGDSGYGSPTKLWWSMAPLAFNTAAMLLAAHTLRTDEPSPRRLGLLRFAETLLTGFNLAIVVVWLGVAASGRPSIQLLRPALVAAAAIVALAALLALTLHARAALSRTS